MLVSFHKYMSLAKWSFSLTVGQFHSICLVIYNDERYAGVSVYEIANVCYHDVTFIGISINAIIAGLDFFL